MSNMTQSDELIKELEKLRWTNMKLVFDGELRLVDTTSKIADFILAREQQLNDRVAKLESTIAEMVKVLKYELSRISQTSQEGKAMAGAIRISEAK